MQIEEYNTLTKLFDEYGALLSKKQYDVLDKVLGNDLGESELAEISGQSRQSVHDALAKAKRQLFIFEQQCGFVSSQSQIKLELEKIESLLDAEKFAEAKEKVSKMIEKL